MENKINIAELLKDCPKGMELDCTMFDDVTFINVEEKVKPICIRTGDIYRYLTKFGTYTFNKNAKCVIFPKGKTTWEGFVPCRFKDGDVLFHSDSASNGIFIFKEILQCGSIQKVICYCDYDSEDGFCLGENHICCYTDSKILHPATKEQREILFQKMKEAGYKWNAETKTLEKLIKPKFKVGDKIKRKGNTRLITIKDVRDNYYIITILDGFNNCYITDKLLFSNQDKYELVPNKFDINTLVPLESKVLVRNVGYWVPAFWGYYSKEYKCPFVVDGGNTFAQCIPYEGNEHLLGTTNDCDDFYKTW